MYVISNIDSAKYYPNNNFEQSNIDSSTPSNVSLCYNNGISS